MPDARAHAPATSCLPAHRWRHTREPRTPPRPLYLPSLPLDPIPSSACLPRTPPSGARRHHRCTHGHRPPLASPMPQEAPRVLPLPPQRATRPRTCRIAAINVVFYLGPAGHLRQIRRLRCVSEPTEPPCCIPVSLPSFPLTSLSLAHPVAAAPQAPEAAVRHGR